MGREACEETAAHHKLGRPLRHSVSISVNLEGEFLSTSLGFILYVFIFDNCIDDAQFTSELAVELLHDILKCLISNRSYRTYDLGEEPGACSASQASGRDINVTPIKGRFNKSTNMAVHQEPVSRASGSSDPLYFFGF